MALPHRRRRLDEIRGAFFMRVCNQEIWGSGRPCSFRVEVKFIQQGHSSIGGPVSYGTAGVGATLSSV